MKAHVERVLTVLLVGSALGLGSLLLQRMPPETAEAESASGLLELGSSLPSLRVDLLEGLSIDLSEEQDLLVVFFTTTCVYCEANVAFLRDAARSSSCQLRLLLISYEDKADVSRYWNHIGWDADCGEVMVGTTAKEEITAALGVRTVPTHLWLDADGLVGGWRSGLLTAPAWQHLRFGPAK